MRRPPPDYPRRRGPGDAASSILVATAVWGNAMRLRLASRASQTGPPGTAGSCRSVRFRVVWGFQHQGDTGGTDFVMHGPRLAL